jgi:hypothetical protein
MQTLAYAPPVAVSPQELFSFGDFVHKVGHGIEKAAHYGSEFMQHAAPVVHEA